MRLLILPLILTFFVLEYETIYLLFPAFFGVFTAVNALRRASQFSVCKRKENIRSERHIQ